MKAVTKKFVTFNYPGVFVNEQSTEEIKSRKIENLDIPEGAFSFYFFDQECIVKGPEVFEGKIKNRSKIHYIGGKVYTIAEVKRKFPKEKILIGNMERNGYDKVIKTRTGNWQPFDKMDIHIKE